MAPGVDSHFVRHLRARLAAEQMTQSQLAARLRVHKSLVSFVLGGRKPVTEGFATSVTALWPEFADHYAADMRAKARIRATA